MITDRIRLDGRVAMVVGAGGGRMGTETALALMDAGAIVVGVDISAEQLDKTDQRRALQHEFIPMVADVTDVEQIDGVINTAWERFGTLQHLVHVVGGTRPNQWSSLIDCPEGLFEDVMNFNLTPVFETCRRFARKMIEGDVQGSIVNFSSMSAVNGAPMHGAYGAAKRAVRSLTQTMALEWGRYGIRVNAVAPGATARSRSGAKLDPTWNPLLRGAELDQVAAVALFLVGPLRRYDGADP